MAAMTPTIYKIILEVKIKVKALDKTRERGPLQVTNE